MATTSPAAVRELIPLSDLERAQAPLESAWTLPAPAYTNAEIFELEKDAIFRADWICVGREDGLTEPGDYRCADLIDQPLVVVRGEDRVLRAFSRVCLHRAMPLAEGEGNCKRFVCPYHKWTYELDGRLRAAPMMDGVEAFDAQSCRLPELALACWEGFVFVSLNPEPRPLAEQLRGLSERLAPYNFGQLKLAATIEYDSPWNWKILVENFMEAYHHIGTHEQSLQPVYPAREATVEADDDGLWALLRMPAKAESEEGLPLLPGLKGPEARQLLAMVVYPTLLFAASPQLGVYYELVPSAHDNMQLRIHALVPEAVLEHLDDSALEALTAQLRTVHEEDIEANAGPWRGLNAPMTRQGRLSRYEEAIWRLNGLWLNRLGAALGLAS